MGFFVECSIALNFREAFICESFSLHPVTKVSTFLAETSGLENYKAGSVPICRPLSFLPVAGFCPHNWGQGEYEISLVGPICGGAN
jgi:hypothetical protein